MHDPKLLEEAVAGWTGTHRFEFCGQPLTVEIEQLDVLPRALASVYASTMEGLIDPGPDTTLGVVDAGHMATDWLVARLPRELPRYSGFATSVAGVRLVEVVEDILLDEGLVRINPLAALEASVTGKYVEGSRELELPTEALEEMRELMAQQLTLTLRQSWRDLALDQVLLTGGLGEVLAPLLEGARGLPGLVLAGSPRTGVARGAYEFAVRQPEREAVGSVED